MDLNKYKYMGAIIMFLVLWLTWYYVTPYFTPSPRKKKSKMSTTKTKQVIEEPTYPMESETKKVQTEPSSETSETLNMYENNTIYENVQK